MQTDWNMKNRLINLTLCKIHLTSTKPFGQYSDEDIINTNNREQDDEQLDKEEHFEPIETH
ncbi:hypothetical protein BpHYR1_008969 [Brachionus plicatilis]|uniref:Uncharacterized protein n=1 Tax=Brachionus plicatilis TaxID=10195 RepID=A0A3M7RX09_BRAPC|nr:hypothetical protein BpHYR1_008969 [Brachionus plicatilis]